MIESRELHVVALSGGKDSTAMAIQLVRLYPEIEFVFVCTPTGNEPPEMFAHWRRIGELLGKPLLPVMGGTLEGLILKQNALPNWQQRWCTRMLKIEPYAAWLMQQTKKYDRIISYVGLRIDEPEREGGDFASVPGVEMVFPMREWGWAINDVLDFLHAEGITIPKRTDCMLCFYQRLIEWWELYWYNREAFDEGIRFEKLTGHTFRSPGRDTWPAALEDLGALFEAGFVPRETRKPDRIGDLKCRVCTK